MASPVALEWAADALLAEARVVPTLLDAPVGHAGLNVWEGPAQEALWDALHHMRRALADAGEDLTRLAGALRREAADIRAAEALAEHRRLERLAAERADNSAPRSYPRGRVA